MAEQGWNQQLGPSVPVAYPQLPEQLPPSYNETVSGTAGRNRFNFALCSFLVTWKNFLNV